MLEIRETANIDMEDMRFENGHIVTDFTKRARTDQSLRGIKKFYKENPQKANQAADEIIKIHIAH